MGPSTSVLVLKINGVLGKVLNYNANTFDSTKYKYTCKIELLSIQTHDCILYCT